MIRHRNLNPICCFIIISLNWGIVPYTEGYKINFWFNPNLGMVTDNNVYKNYTNLADIYTNLNLNSGISQKFTPHFYLNIDGQLDTRNYMKYTQENYLYYNFHSELKYLWGTVGELRLEPSWEQITSPQQITFYNFNRLLLSPNVLIYLTDTVTLKYQYLHDTVVYPVYDLDYRGENNKIEFTAELTYHSEINLVGSRRLRFYPERYLFLNTNGETNISNRTDNDAVWDLVFTERFIKGQVQFVYSYYTANSNANFWDYGPDLTPTTFDDLLINGYYNLRGNKTGITLVYDLGKSINSQITIYYDSSNYLHRPAKDNNQSLTFELQQDNVTVSNITLFIPLYDISGLAKLQVEFNYVYEQNQSNSYPYAYQNHSTGISLTGTF